MKNMIKVKLVLLEEDLRKIAGAKEVIFELPEESTVKELLENAALKYGKEIMRAPSREGVLIILNGQNIEFLGGLNAKLSDGDRVVILPPVDGG
ncbi:MAG: MoaD/ThiS family protein [Candidatus Bathyarchaeia archaeon]